MDWNELFRKYHLTSTRIKNSLKSAWDKPEKFEEIIWENPYRVLIIRLGKSFKVADELILEYHPEYKSSLLRTVWACWRVLKDNENDGDTCCPANALGKVIIHDYPELKSFIFEAVTTDPMFHYEMDTKIVSLAMTYEAECTIADAIKYRVKHPRNDGMDWGKYKATDSFDLTDEQMSFLKAVNENSIVMLNGPGGCVDCDTEFFNGSGWKRIADYETGDKVLQYNDDGSATLVNPIAYIKKPCNMLWHFETKYGINQTLCDEHRIIYWSTKGFKHECRIDEIIDKQNNGGWNGKFKTTFNYGNSGISLTDEEIKVMCAVICDGSFYNYKDKYKCRFHIKKDRKKERLRLLFSQANISWTETESSAKGYTDFYIISPITTKIFNADWYNCTHHQLEIICLEIMFWDGSINKTNNGVIRKRYSTTVKANADFIQFAYSACGYRASISVNDRVGQKHITDNKEYIRKSIEYTVTISDKTMVGICADNREGYNKTPIEQVPTTDGYKYCFTVPSHMLVLRRKNCIFVTGNCGKSAVVKALTQMLWDNNFTFTLLAPTGIAAKRLRQATGYPASTIHMNLALGEKAPIGQYLVIDECSMIGVHLLSTLLYKVPKETKIILICDEAQLASISCGNIVQDIITSGIVPTINLTKVFRYGKGGIETIATDIRMGKPLTGKSEYNDYTFVPISKAKTDVLNAYQGLLQNYDTKDILVLSPFNVREAGAYAINNTLQDNLNSNSNLFTMKKQGTDISFRKSDMVVNTENNYHAQGEYGDIPIMNGDIGVIKGYDGLNMEVEFEAGTVYLEKNDIYKLLLGYALTIHKVQGMQAKAVIVIVDKSHGFFLTRNLLYVACSRAQEKLIVIGDIDTINNALPIQQEKNRETYLKDLLTN